MEVNFANKTLNKVTLNEKKDFYVTSSKVYCEGMDENSTHPKVFMKISKVPGARENSTTCPYCGQKFILKNYGK